MNLSIFTITVGIVAILALIAGIVFMLITKERRKTWIATWSINAVAFCTMAADYLIQSEVSNGILLFLMAAFSIFIVIHTLLDTENK